MLHRCAIGCLLTEAGLSETVSIDTTTAFEHSTIWGDVSVRAIGANLASLQELGFKLHDLDGVNHEFLDEAQVIHDSTSNWDADGFNFNVKALDDMAFEYGLTVPVEESEGAPLEAVLV